jgi:peptidoglycan hydrolase CwlO-like protein
MKRKIDLRIIGVFFLTVAFVLAPVSVLGEEKSTDRLQSVRTSLKEEQAKIEEFSSAYAELSEKEDVLREEVGDIEKEIEQLERDIRNTQSETEKISKELTQIREELARMDKEIATQKIMISQYMNNLYEKNKLSLLQMFLTNVELSDLVGSIDNVGNVQSSLSGSVEMLRVKETEIVDTNQHLFDKEAQLASLQKLQADQANLLESTKKEKEIILNQTKEEGAKYKEMLKNAKDKESDLLGEIRLLGGTGGGIGYDLAYEYAKKNAARLGGKIRPEFMVGIMKIESGLGGNVGKSYYKDSLSGCAAQPGNNTRQNFMGQEQAFEKIIKNLGLSLSQPVSECPFPNYIGTGGAMGPAQVMPQTWLGYEPRLQQMKGGKVNPWDVEDAMLAVGMILLGKVGDQSMIDNPSLERTAATRYLGGGGHGWYADKALQATEDVRKVLGL